ncbi:MAG: Hsp70 family protein [Bifidobacteriaceae bacterium]|jgi:hypothetical protein|nr:Hsp70 family protein [Bifidobacteriaceae bacterium]
MNQNELDLIKSLTEKLQTASASLLKISGISDSRENQPKTKEASTSEWSSGPTKEAESEVPLNHATTASEQSHEIFYGVSFDNKGFTMAVSQDLGDPVCVPLTNGEDLYLLSPSVYLPEGSNYALVGDVAKDKFMSDPATDSKRGSVKILSSSDRDISVKWNGRDYDQIDLIALVLKLLKSSADKIIKPVGNSKIHERTVITCPDKWPYFRRLLLANAAKIAGFKGVSIINKRMAAAIYWFDKARSENSSSCLVLNCDNYGMDLVQFAFRYTDVGKWSIFAEDFRSSQIRSKTGIRKFIDDTIKRIRRKNKDLSKVLCIGDEGENYYDDQMLNLSSEDLFELQKINTQKLAKGAALSQIIVRDGPNNQADSGKTKKKVSGNVIYSDKLSTFLYVIVAFQVNSSPAKHESKPYNLFKPGNSEKKRPYVFTLDFPPERCDYFVLNFFERPIFDLKYTAKERTALLEEYTLEQFLEDKDFIKVCEILVRNVNNVNVSSVDLLMPVSTQFKIPKFESLNKDFQYTMTLKSRYCKSDDELVSIIQFLENIKVVNSDIQTDESINATPHFDAAE